MFFLNNKHNWGETHWGEIGGLGLQEVPDVIDNVVFFLRCSSLGRGFVMIMR